MKDIGDYLKEVRLARGFTQSDVEIATRIPAKYLEAIERGDFDKLPGNAYSIGFLRSYAKFLKVDSDELVDYYKDLAGIKDETAAPLVGHIRSADKEALAKANYRPMKKWQAGLIISFLLLVAAGGVLYYLGSGKNDPAPSGTQTTDQGQTTQTGDGSQTAVIPSVDGDTSDQTSTATQTNDGTAVSDVLTVRITATKGPCWIEATNSAGSENHYLNRGDEITLTADSYLKIKYGSAGAVEVYVNNELQESLGGMGVVITKEYQKK